MNSDQIKCVMAEVKKAVIGKDEVVEKVMTAILAGGHILIEDIPGVGKTTMALAFSKAMSLKWQRVQFTPDVLPSDITGFTVYNKEKELFEYKAGTAMCNLLLADEINRTSPKTQSALLEVMEEGSITVEGVTHEIPKPFVVIATQNPAGSAGTQQLPESQMDRFIVRLSMGYPEQESEIDMLRGKQCGEPLDAVRSILERDVLLLFQKQTRNIFVDELIYKYVTELAGRTRTHSMLKLGVSPRGSIALVNMAKAAAFLHGREYVIPEDVQGVFIDVCSHRIVLGPKSRSSETSSAEILKDILKSAGGVKLRTRGKAV